jgi:hypothetical protein
MKVFCITAGLSLILLSLVACGVSIIAIVDPVGTKMADDNDPYGSPPSRYSSLAILSVSVAVGAAGICLVRRSFHPRDERR